jgi:hypothetical protein
MIYQGINMEKKVANKKERISYVLSVANLTMVNLTTTQVETLFGELEYIEPQLKALGVADEDVDNV